MSDIFRLRNGRSRAINAENPTGEKGKGGIAANTTVSFGIIFFKHGLPFLEGPR